MESHLAYTIVSGIFAYKIRQLISLHGELTDLPHNRNWHYIVAYHRTSYIVQYLLCPTYRAPLAAFQHFFDHLSNASLVAFSLPLTQCVIASPCNARPKENDSAGRRENADDGEDELTSALTAARFSVATDDDSPPREHEMTYTDS